MSVEYLPISARKRGKKRYGKATGRTVAYLHLSRKYGRNGLKDRPMKYKRPIEALLLAFNARWQGIMSFGTKNKQDCYRVYLNNADTLRRLRVAIDWAGLPANVLAFAPIGEVMAASGGGEVKPGLSGRLQREKVKILERAGMPAVLKFLLFGDGTYVPPCQFEEDAVIPVQWDRPIREWDKLVNKFSEFPLVYNRVCRLQTAAFLADDGTYAEWADKSEILKNWIETTLKALPSYAGASKRRAGQGSDGNVPTASVDDGTSSATIGMDGNHYCI